MESLIVSNRDIGLQQSLALAAFRIGYVKFHLVPAGIRHQSEVDVLGFIGADTQRDGLRYLIDLPNILSAGSE